MAKIEQMTLENFKAVSKFHADFKGCSAIVTAGNDKGKTSFLRGIIDRIRFKRPDIMVKNGEKEGHGEMVLDTGEKFIWEFDNEKLDKLVYISDKGVRKSVTTELGSRFFPKPFDIDKFVSSTPKEQRKQLQEISTVDFTEIDTRYQLAYNNRHEKNFEAEKFHVKLTSMLEVPKVDFVDLTELQGSKEKERNRLNALYLENKAKNDAVRAAWNQAKDQINTEVNKHNDLQKSKQDRVDSASDSLVDLKKVGYEGKEVSDWIEGLKKEIEPLKVATSLYPKEPDYIIEKPSDETLQAIDAKILEASEINTRAKAYKDYVDYKAQVDKAKIEAEEADQALQCIDNERKEMISRANFPKGISFDNDGLTIDSLPMKRDQISSSLLYKTALRIGAMKLGEVKTLYFDASYLDRNSLEEIEKWANENELQLLIERPDFDGGEIRYELIENK